MQFVARYYQFGIKIEEEKYIFCLFYENQKIGDSSTKKNNCISDLFFGFKTESNENIYIKKTVASITLASTGTTIRIVKGVGRA